jgi:hypothetical protein
MIIVFTCSFIRSFSFESNICSNIPWHVHRLWRHKRSARVDKYEVKIPGSANQIAIEATEFITAHFIRFAAGRATHSAAIDTTAKGRHISPGQVTGIAVRKKTG